MSITYWAPAGWTGRRTVDGIEISVSPDGVIESVAAVPAPARSVVRLDGVVLPGFVNAHSHVFHRALRGLAHDPGDFWSWRRLMYDMAARLQPDTLEALAAAVFGEMALAGITTVGEFHYVHHDTDGAPYADPNEMAHALVRAARTAGINLVLLDACYLTADVNGSPVTGVQKRFSDGSAEAWSQRVDDLDSEYAGAADVSVGVAAHSVRAVPEQSLEVVAATGAGKPLHVHVSEQRAENDATLAALGRTPVQVLADTGVLGSSSTAVHATHVTREDVELLAASGTSVCVCPTTERDLGDGWAPAAEFVQAGIRLALGSDSHAVIDFFEEARAIELNDRARLERRGIHDPHSLLRAAGAGGSSSLGRGTGEIEAGQRADFLAVRADTTRLSGSTEPAAIVFGAVAADVTDVIVSGRPIVRESRHLELDPVGGKLGSVLGRLREPA